MRLLSLAILAMMFSSSAALACSCADATPRSCNLLANHDVSVFVGTVASVENPPMEGDNRGGTARYYFHVDEWLSPDVRGEVENVLSGRGGGFAVSGLRLGSPTWFAYRGDNGELHTTICSNTQRVADAGRFAHSTEEPCTTVTSLADLRHEQSEDNLSHCAATTPNFDKLLHKSRFIFESSKRKIVAKTADDGSFAVYEIPSARLPDLP